MAEGPGPIPSAGRVLGLDHGDARIGVAISDPGQRLAVPHGTIHTGAPTDLKAVSAIVTAEEVVGVVVGHPLSMSGEPGTRAGHAEAFAETLNGFLRVPVVLQDERLSTAEAERALAAAGASARQRKAASDRAAATVILQAWLDRRRGSGAPGAS